MSCENPKHVIIRETCAECYEVMKLEHEQMVKVMGAVLDAMDEFVDSTAKYVEPKVVAFWKDRFSQFKAAKGKEKS